jgi:hypothetical protein
MCTSPRAVQFNHDGSLNWRRDFFNPTMEPFQVPCGKCAECLLERARDWSIRCLHESKMHDKSCFITLTYSDKYLPTNKKLDHSHYQNFMYKLRQRFGTGIGFFMCGEYGTKTLRPHYHACLFGIDFPDKNLYGKTDLSHDLWTSDILDTLWGMNDPIECPNKIGAVTQQSAGYVARYVLKKQDKDHPQGYQKMSRANAIGKSWIQKWYSDVFISAKGSIILDDGTKTKVPRYYEKWLKTNKPEIWTDYVTHTKIINTERLKKKAEQEHEIYLNELSKRKSFDTRHYKSPLARKREILKHKQKQLKRNFL